MWLKIKHDGDNIDIEIGGDGDALTLAELLYLFESKQLNKSIEETLKDYFQNDEITDATIKLWREAVVAIESKMASKPVIDPTQVFRRVDHA